MGNIKQVKRATWTSLFTAIKEREHLFRGQIYPQGPGFTASVQSILQLVNQFTELFPNVARLQPLAVHSLQISMTPSGDQKQPETLQF